MPQAAAQPDAVAPGVVRLEPIRGGRWRAVHWLPLGALALWSGLLFVTNHLLSRQGVEGAACVFRHVTGEPCGLCRGTRATAALAHGDLWQAVVWNPFATAMVLGGLGWAVMTYGFGRRLAFSRVGWRALVALTGLAFALNWVYVWYAERGA